MFLEDSMEDQRSTRSCHQIDGVREIWHMKKEGILKVALPKPQQPQPFDNKTEKAHNPHLGISKGSFRKRQADKRWYSQWVFEKQAYLFIIISDFHTPLWLLKQGLVLSTTGLPADSLSCDRQRSSAADERSHVLLLPPTAHANLCFLPRNNLSPVFCWRLTLFNLIVVFLKDIFKSCGWILRKCSLSEYSVNGSHMSKYLFLFCLFCCVHIWQVIFSP